METKTTKNAVVESYGKLASATRGGIMSKLFACCDPAANAHNVGKTIGYSEEILNAVPQDSNLGIGCGNPSGLANLKEGDTVVDLGSGAGFDAFIISRIVKEKGNVIGVDLSDEMLALANRNAVKGNYANVSFLKGDIEDLPFDDNIADHIISNCVINLSLNKSEVFREAYRVLKPGGKMSISDIVLEKELPAYIKDSLAGRVACVSGAEKIADYLKYIQEAGFKNIKIESKSPFPLELMLTDPQIMKLANEMDFAIDDKEAKDIASRVLSVTLSAIK